MADNLFQLKIITPERIFYEGEVSMVEFNTTEGEIGVLKNHIPLTTVIAPGIVTIHEEEENKKAVVHAGFAEILEEKVTILAEIAEWPGEIDLDRARAAEDRAKERLNDKTGDWDVARAEYALKKALIRQDILAD